MKKSITFLTAICMTAALAGCAKSAPTPQPVEAEKVTLQYMTLADGKVLEAERHIVENYMKKNPNVVVEITSVPALDTRLKQNLPQVRNRISTCSRQEPVYVSLHRQDS